MFCSKKQQMANPAGGMIQSLREGNHCSAGSCAEHGRATPGTGAWSRSHALGAHWADHAPLETHGTVRQRQFLLLSLIAESLSVG